MKIHSTTVGAVKIFSASALVVGAVLGALLWVFMQWKTADPMLCWQVCGTRGVKVCSQTVVECYNPGMVDSD